MIRIYLKSIQLGPEALSSNGICSVPDMHMRVVKEKLLLHIGLLRSSDGLIIQIIISISITNGLCVVSLSHTLLPSRNIGK